MYRLLMAAARLALALTSMLVLITILFGIPILFVGAIFAVCSAVAGYAFTWNYPILIGIGIDIFICLVFADMNF